MPTTATPARLGGMVAVAKDSKVKPLGYIVWFSVPDENVPVRQLRKVWTLAGLDPSSLPREQRAVNIFKRAVRDQAGIHRDEINRTITETDVRMVLENDQDVIYQVSRVGRDLEKAEVIYERALKVWFNKATELIEFQALGGSSRRDVLTVMDAIQETYDSQAKTVTGAKVRTLVRHFIKDDADEGWKSDSGKVYGRQVGLSGENLRGKAGGVYFVLAKFEDEIERLAEMLDNLYKPQGRAYLYAVPLADGSSERELVRRNHAMNSIGDIEETMGEVAKLLRPINPSDPAARSRAPRENVIKLHWLKLEQLRRRAAQYRDVLKEEQEDVDVHMDLLNKQLRKLMAL